MGHQVCKDAVNTSHRRREVIAHEDATHEVVARTSITRTQRCETNNNPTMPTFKNSPLG